ncbi:MAG: V-type ATP synthase subunit I [Spirochaetia bacterium]
MKKMELLIMKDDVDSVVRYLARAGCVQLISEPGEQRELSREEREIAELQIKIESLAHFLDVTPGSGGEDHGPAPARVQLRERAARLVDDLKGLVDEERRLLERRLSLSRTLEELSAFADVRVSFDEIDQLSQCIYRMGVVEPEKLDILVRRLEKRAFVLKLKTPGQFLAVGPRKSRWALDSELKKLGFQEKKFPEGMRGIPADMLSAVHAELDLVDGMLRELQEKKLRARDAKSEEIRFLVRHLTLDVSIDAVKQGFASTGSVQKVSGWVPRGRFREVAADIESLTGGTIALRTYDPEELSEVKTGKIRVPVSTPHGKIVRSFERMVFSYSIPAYGTIDPTPFVSVIFVLLFGIMFGDVGQGFVGLALGLLINSGWVKSFEAYRRKNFGMIFVLAGISAMIAGFLYGSFFANENVLVPATRLVTQLLIGRPMDHIISLVGFQKIILFFGVTIGIGAVINSIGLLINIVNNLARRSWEKAFLSKTGLAGALFFWYMLFLAVRVLAAGRPSGTDAIGLALPLLALFFREPLIRLAEGHRPILKEGLFGFIMEGIVEILESTIYYVSNSISFLRVAAFGLAHTVLSAIVFLLAGMVGGAPGGIVFSIIVILIGNSIIIILEGLIVTIQIVRLQYYEFFSKFFDETGEEFRPFSLRTSGGLR